MMRVGTPGFVPERLVEARAARRIQSMKELARILGVNPSSVSRWETGKQAPEAEALSELAKALRVRREFFLRPVFDSSRPMFYRKLASTLKRDREYQKSQVNWLHEISDVLQHYVDYPELDIPDMLGGSSYKQLRDEDIEDIAGDLRTHWQLGQGPCTNVVAVLEKIGCVVGSIEMGTSKLDGVCSWSKAEDRPHILLASDKMNLPRRQMDAAHELGHAVLHKGVSAGSLRDDLKEIERQAFRFASAFLMPQTTYVPEVPNFSLAGLLSLKERWRVSVKAQIKRLLDLEIIPPDHGTQLYKTYSAKGWSRQEPMDREWAVTKPRMLRDALYLIVDSGTRTKEDLLSVEFTMHPGDIENIANLPSGWFTKNTGDVVPLTLKPATPRGTEPPAGGSVISFFRREQP
jgi:Zn-dependent peptidase ImmA (M78 family)/transcriptional regulator with XRE-family HTH domain|tara:strand:- start:7440 stop:8651 length:1212 start_codon:yes stop_codon:yes gene_type:complete